MQIKQQRWIIILVVAGVGLAAGVLFAPPDVIMQLVYGIGGAVFFGGIVWVGGKRSKGKKWLM